MTRCCLTLALLGLLALSACHRPAPTPTPPPETAASAPLAGVPSGLVSDSDVGEYPEPSWLLTSAKALELTATQTATIRQASDKFLAETKTDRALLDKQSEAFFAYLREHGEKVDPAEVQKRNGAAAEASARVMAARKKAWEPLWKQLTAQQQATVKELRASSPFQLR